VRNDSTTTDGETPPAVVDQNTPYACPRCGAILALEDLQPGAHRFDQTTSVLVDHLLVIQDQFTEIKRLVEEVLPFSTHCDRN
jgi:hypothetical protein